MMLGVRDGEGVGREGVVMVLVETFTGAMEFTMMGKVEVADEMDFGIVGSVEEALEEVFFHFVHGTGRLLSFDFVHNGIDGEDELAR